MSAADNLKPKGLKKQLQAVSAARRAKNVGEVEVVAAAHAPPRRNDIQPLMATVMKPINQLKPAPHRARVPTPELRVALLSSVGEFGILMPILIDGKDQIIAGHELWEAAKELGISKIECRVADHLSPVECEAASLALNKIGDLGGYDLDVLRDRMIVIKSAGIKLRSTGFTIPQIDQILMVPKPVPAGPDEEGDDDDDDFAEVTRLGDLFGLGDHRLLCGDSLEPSSYELVLAGQTAACVFSDPPYGCDIEGFASGLGKHKHHDFIMGCDLDDAGLADFFLTFLAHCKASTSPGAVIFACMDSRQIDTLLIAGREVGLTRNNIACWNKGSGGMGGLYRNASEFVAVFVNGKSPATNNVELGVHGRDRTNVWTYPGANRNGSSAAKALADHPTPKPVELVRDALLDVTNPGDVVLDPFSGSGTTIIAAEACGRIGCGIELDPKYIDRSIRRWEALTGQQAVHLESGLTFAELAAQRTSTDQGLGEAE